MIINGTFADELIVGTDGDDTIRGDWGDDEIRAGAGNDVVYGGQGNDLIHGEDGNDILYDEEGDDRVFGGAGNDILYSLVGHFGHDILDGGEGDDSFSIIRTNIRGSAEAFGGAGADSFSLFDTTGSSFVLDGGAGNDNITVQLSTLAGVVAVSLGAGADMLAVGAFTSGVVNVDDFQAGDAGDRLEIASYLQSTLIGYDRISNVFATGHARTVQSGADTLFQIDRDGSAGSFYGWTTLVTLRNVAAGQLTGYNLGGYPVDGTVAAGISLAGTADADRLLGTMSADTLDGGDGRDLLLGGGGDDILRGGNDGDSLYGHLGDDTIEGGAGSDFIEDGHGNDIVKGEDGADSLSNHLSGNDLLEGGAGNDILNISRSSILTDTVTARGGADNDRITITSQSESSFIVDAGEGDDRVILNGVNGAATITLGGGADRLTLGLPSASALAAWGEIKVTDFQTGNGADILEFTAFLRTAAPGWDQVTNPFSNGFARMVESGADAVLQISNNADPANFKAIVTFLDTGTSAFTAWNLYGWPVDGSPPPGLTLTGTALGESIEGTAGGDTIDALEGADSVTAGAGNDTVRGGLGNDTLRGGTGDDLLDGGDGDDTLFGDAGSDVINGGEGNDEVFVNTGTGADTVHGDGGNDRVHLNAVANLVSGGGGDDLVEISLQSGAAGATTLTGGEGSDTFLFYTGGLVDFALDAGDGNDVVSYVQYNRNSTFTLGAGSDAISFQPAYPAVPMGAAEILDFTAGTGGDYLNLESLLYYTAATDFDVSAFSLGLVRLVQEGADTLIQLDLDGAAGSEHGFVTAAILRGTVAADLTPGNIGYGSEGPDVFRLDIAQDVSAFGKGGNDSYYLGANLSPGDYLIGGLGSDRVAIQGDYSAGVVLDESTLTDIETLALLSGSDTSFGGAGTELYSYFLTLHDENVEPGATLTVYFKDLQAGEDVIFDGRAETNSRFVVIGGGGDDVVAGGAGNDSLDGGLGTDTLFGGLGNDLYFVDAGDTVLELGDEGTDEIRTALGSRVDPAQMYLLPEHVENLTGTAVGAQGVSGNASDNRIRLGAGGDLVVLDGGGNDRVESGGGNDFLFYGAAFTAADSNDGGAGS
jgi:Ca2+-binding RTX toxin-like protein